MNQNPAGAASSEDEPDEDESSSSEEEPETPRIDRRKAVEDVISREMLGCRKQLNAKLRGMPESWGGNCPICKKAYADTVRPRRDLEAHLTGERCRKGKKISFLCRKLYDKDTAHLQAGVIETRPTALLARAWEELRAQVGPKSASSLSTLSNWDREIRILLDAPFRYGVRHECAHRDAVPSRFRHTIGQGAFLATDKFIRAVFAALIHPDTRGLRKSTLIKLELPPNSLNRNLWVGLVDAIFGSELAKAVKTRAETSIDWTICGIDGTFKFSQGIL